jgi:hypothetical protein
MLSRRALPAISTDRPAPRTPQGDGSVLQTLAELNNLGAADGVVLANPA